MTRDRQYFKWEAAVDEAVRCCEARGVTGDVLFEELASALRAMVAYNRALLLRVETLEQQSQKKFPYT